MAISVNTNYSNVRRFEAFTAKAAKDDNAILSDILSGKIATEEQRKERHDELANRSFNILPDSWRELANKKGKTQEEIARMAKEYEQGFTNFGNEYVKYIDAKYGNGDGILKENEYVNFEKGTVVEGADVTKDAKTIFAHIDLDKNGNVDAREMAAMMSMFDMSVGLQGDKAGSINGKIKICDFRANMSNLIKPSNTADGAAMDNKLKGMFGFLYGEN